MLPSFEQYLSVANEESEEHLIEDEVDEKRTNFILLNLAIHIRSVNTMSQIFTIVSANTDRYAAINLRSEYG